MLQSIKKKGPLDCRNAWYALLAGYNVQECFTEGVFESHQTVYKTDFNL
jgi:hypothetical protein